MKKKKKLGGKKAALPNCKQGMMVKARPCCRQDPGRHAVESWCLAGLGCRKACAAEAAAQMWGEDPSSYSPPAPEPPAADKKPLTHPPAPLALETAQLRSVCSQGS